MTANQLRKKFTNFFISKKHKKINSAPLVPENDPSVLFTTAGMHPLLPFLLGEKHPAGKRLTGVQKCLRTDDIEQVGDATHSTFFEMLGNWSLDYCPKIKNNKAYWKKKAIEYSWEFLIKELKLDKKRLAVSCFAGDRKNNILKDAESAKIWQSLGISKQRIVFLQNNWWGPVSNIGPCGPDTEMFYWIPNNINPPKKFDPDDSRWVEIWNNVFMQYNKKIKYQKSKIKNIDQNSKLIKGKNIEYEFTPLKQKNVDTGMGLERTLMILQNKKDIYQTELFLPIINLIKTISEKYNERSTRIIADHIRASAFIIADGVKPSNLGQGYILRRLIRRIIRYVNLIQIFDKNYFKKFVKCIINNYKNVYPEINHENKIVGILKQEQKKFEITLKLGEKEFAKLIQNIKQRNQDTISGRAAFKLFESYGLPIEMIKEMAKEENIKLDITGFNKAFEKHQLLSRAGAEKKFKGGLIDNSKQVIKLHTTAHLLHSALRKILGEHVCQCGSNITTERLRFDFCHPKKLTNEEKKKVENLVNKQIKKELPVKMVEMGLKDAKASGALGFFESKYGKIVKVYTVGKSDRDFFSREICGGPHVENTKELGHFKIISEKSSSAGIRRIKAILD